MLRNTFLILCVLCTAILIGCSKTETGNSNMATNNSNKGTSTTSTSAPAGDKIGIAECDDYIAKYEACTAKVPEMARAAYKNALDQTRAQWKKLAENPQTRESLAAACKQAAEREASAWKMYGCSN